MEAACDAGTDWACGIQRVYRVDSPGNPGAGLVIEYTSHFAGFNGNAPAVAQDPQGMAASIIPELPDTVESVSINRVYAGVAYRGAQ